MNLVRVAVTITLLAVSQLRLFAQKDIVIADFEGGDYGDWIVTGTAFGNGPAQGTLKGQMSVSGFMGHGLVNSFNGGDDPMGTLTSPEFKIERKYLNFLIGGGNFDGRTCMNLIVGGKQVRTATGSNSEHLDWATWDVSEFVGKSARVEIVDSAKGGWGHINIDQITESDHRYEHFVVLDPLYGETYRPQFHFTARMGWLNDPNGLVYYAGEYHMFFQHNPFDTAWGNMTWGHAVSKDMLHWHQLPNAIEPDSRGTVFSGSAVVDVDNTAGLQKGTEKTLIAMYTAAGGTNDISKGVPFTQCMAYSTDKGRTWTKYSGNPTILNIKGENRDPKVVWHKETKQWIVALFIDGNDYALYHSKDLKKWEHLQTLNLPGCSECPDFFEMPIKGQSGKSAWVFTAANGQYLTGSFDGNRFVPDQKLPLKVEYGGNSYAVQTFSDLPGRSGRRVQIAWMNGGNYPQMPFNQQMGIPTELVLKSTADGLRLFKTPISEISKLHSQNATAVSVTVNGEPITPTKLESDLMEIETVIEIKEAKSVSIMVRGQEIRYDVATSKLSTLGHEAPLKPANGFIKLHVLLDRTSLEVFGNDGQVALTTCFLPVAGVSAPTVSTEGGPAILTRWSVYRLKSAW